MSETSLFKQYEKTFRLSLSFPSVRPRCPSSLSSDSVPLGWKCRCDGSLKLRVKVGQKHLDEAPMVHGVRSLIHDRLLRGKDIENNSVVCNFGPKPRLFSPLFRTVGEITVRIHRPCFHLSVRRC